MTTNVFDKKRTLLTSDSRWSSTNGDWVAYVDDTGYDKVAFTERAGFVFAGDMTQIDDWKRYVSGGMKKGTRPPLPSAQTWVPGKKVCVIQVDLATSKPWASSVGILTSGVGALITALYAGTGSVHARACWEKNRCAKQAVKSAAEADLMSGGEVMFLNCATRETNVTNTSDMQGVQDQLKDRGYIMSTQHAPVLLKDAANDPSSPAAQFAKAVLSGAVPLTAPFDGMDEPWTDEKVAEFEALLDEYEVD